MEKLLTLILPRKKIRKFLKENISNKMGKESLLKIIDY